MQQCIESLYAWHLHAHLLRKLDGRAKVRLDFHWPACQEILIHYAVCFCWYDHLLHRLFSEVRLKLAALSFCDGEEFVNDTGYQRADADLLEKLGM